MGGPPWPPLDGVRAMPTSPDFPYPRSYNSLRLLGFDYGHRARGGHGATMLEYELMRE